MLHVLLEQGQILQFLPEIVCWEFERTRSVSTATPSAGRPGDVKRLICITVPTISMLPCIVFTPLIVDALFVLKVKIHY